MNTAPEEWKKEMMRSLKIREWHRKKWSRKPAHGHLIRKQKLNTKRGKFYFTQRKPKSVDDRRPASEGDGVDKKTKRDQKEQVGRVKKKTLAAEDRVKLLYEKGTYNTKLRSNISERLHVEVPEINIQAKTDIDPAFFTMIEGRPNKKPFSRVEYIEKEKAILKKKAMIVDIMEKISFMRKDIDERERLLNEAEMAFPLRAAEIRNSIYKSFDTIEEAYSRKMEAQKRYMLALERKKNLESEIHKVRISLYKLEERWRSQKIYQAFLYRISPLEWRKEHDRIHYSNGKLILEPTSSSYDEYYLDPNKPEPPLEDLLKLFEEKTKDEEEPKLYFTDPKQLKEYFDFIQELNANTFHNAMKMEEESKTLDKFKRKVKSSIKSRLQDLQNEHDNFVENIKWLANKRKELNETVRQEEKNLEKRILSENHIKMRSILDGSYNALINSEKFKVGLPLIMKHFAKDVARVIHEVNNIPPDLFKMFKQKQEERILREEQTYYETKRKLRIEKRIKDSTQTTHIPKHLRSLRLRSRPPLTPKKEETKVEEVTPDVLYAEDIFRTGYRIDSPSAKQKVIPKIITSKLLLSSDEEISPSEKLEDKFSLTTYDGTRIKTSFDSMTSSIGFSGSISGTKSLSISLPPNTTIELPPIDTKPHIPKKSCQPLKKPSLILTDFNRRKISLLTNYEKSYSIGDTDGEAKEISFVDVVKTTRIKDYLLRWKNIFPSEKEKISKSSLFQKDSSSLDPYLETIQQKLKLTSKRGFPLKSDIINSTSFPLSPYFPSLPIISETESTDEAYYNFYLPKLEDKLRECKLKFYQHKYLIKAERQD